MAAQLGIFVLARLAGYLVFAAVAWSVGRAFPATATTSLVYGVAHLALGVIIAVYAIGRWRLGRCAATAVTAPPALVTIGAGASPPKTWAMLFGFLTGLSLCPPFLVVGVRVMQFDELALALLFFTLFFLGTLAWFVPFLALGLMRWKEQAMFVARITLLLLALYYLYLGTVILAGRVIRG